MRYVGDIWPDPHIEKLRTNFGAGMSFAENAADINAEFRTRYSRNAAIGKAKRIGLKQAEKPGPQKEKREAVLKVHKPRAVTAPVVELRCAEVTPRNLSIYELTAETCHWPFGDAPPYAYCGCRTLEGLPYCWPHTALAQGPGTASEKAAHRVAG